MWSPKRKMRSPKLKNVESKIAFGQLILGKIIKTVATRCQILGLKCTKTQNSAGLRPKPAGGAYSAPPDPLDGFKGPNYKGREGSGGDGRGWDGMGGEERGREGRGVLCSPKNP